MELRGSETRLDSGMARPTCRVGWPPTPSLSDKSCWVTVWARCPQREKHFIKLKCFCDWEGGREGGDRDKKPMRHPWALCQVPTAGLPHSAVLQAQGDFRPPESSPQFYTHSSECLLLAFGPICLGPLDFVLKALKKAQPSSLPTTEEKTYTYRGGRKKVEEEEEEERGERDGGGRGGER